MLESYKPPADVFVLSVVISLLAVGIASAILGLTSLVTVGLY